MEKIENNLSGFVFAGDIFAEQPVMGDLELLREYAVHKSETAFQTIVERHLALVYSAALRQVSNAALAEDVTQVVFILLARKAGTLPEKTLLTGWLYRTTRHTAAKALRGEYRRSRREHEALALQMDETDNRWEQLAPLLDEAMAQLGELERGAVLLRYFRNKSLREVGDALGLSEDAAQKRVTRAVDKLRRSLSKRSLEMPATPLTGLLATRAAQFAPGGLDSSVAAAALRKARMSRSVYTLLQQAVRQALWPKLAMAGAAAIAAVGLAIATVHSWPQRPRALSYALTSSLVPVAIESSLATKPVTNPPEVDSITSRSGIPTASNRPPAKPHPVVAPAQPAPTRVAAATNAAPQSTSLVSKKTEGSPSPDSDTGTPADMVSETTPYLVMPVVPRVYRLTFGTNQNRLSPNVPAQPVVASDGGIGAQAELWVPPRGIAPAPRPVAGRNSTTPKR